MSMRLDLEGSIRPGLDLLANEIVIALKKRSRFRQNLEIYRPGLVEGQPEVSLLDYELNRVERLHAELGRYAYCEQDALTDVRGVTPVIHRPPPVNPIPPFDSDYAEPLLRFYRDSLEQFLESGTDSDTFGETVTADCLVLQNIYERINLGKLVAEYKLTNNVEGFRATRGEGEAVRPLIVHPEREQRVLELHEHLARHYDFPVAHARHIVLWTIAATTEVQIRYIQSRLRNL